MPPCPQGEYADAHFETTELPHGRSRHTPHGAEDKGVAYVTVFEVVPTGEGSRITMRFDAEQASPGLVARLAWKILGPIGAKATARVMRGDLADIAAAAERS